MARLIKQIFTWWNGCTLSMRFYTWRKGKYMGEDLFGNRYYQGGTTKDGRPRRWVIYKDYSDASTIPPGWHGWIHYRNDIAPSQETYQPYFWEKPHLPNLTGTAAAYSPKGSIKHHGHRAKLAGDYDSWQPENN